MARYDKLVGEEAAFHVNIAHICRNFVHASRVHDAAKFETLANLVPLVLLILVGGFSFRDYVVGKDDASLCVSFGSDTYLGLQDNLGADALIRTEVQAAETLGTSQ